MATLELKNVFFSQSLVLIGKSIHNPGGTNGKKNKTKQKKNLTVNAGVIRDVG